MRCQRTRTPASMRRCGWTSSTAPDASDSDQRQDQGEGDISTPPSRSRLRRRRSRASLKRTLVSLSAGSLRKSSRVAVSGSSNPTGTELL